MARLGMWVRGASHGRVTPPAAGDGGRKQPQYVVHGPHTGLLLAERATYWAPRLRRAERCVAVRVAPPTRVTNCDACLRRLRRTHHQPFVTYLCTSGTNSVERYGLLQWAWIATTSDSHCALRSPHARGWELAQRADIFCGGGGQPREAWSPKGAEMPRLWAFLAPLLAHMDPFGPLRAPPADSVEAHSASHMFVATSGIAASYPLERGHSAPGGPDTPQKARPDEAKP